MNIEVLVCRIVHKQRANAAGVLALGSAAFSSGAIKGTAKCKIRGKQNKKPHQTKKKKHTHIRKPETPSSTRE